MRANVGTYQVVLSSLVTNKAKVGGRYCVQLMT
jgi:hypothetical protein